MPCYVEAQIRINSKMNNQQMLIKSLKDLGMNHRLENGTIVISNSMGDLYISADGTCQCYRTMTATVNKIKEKYAENTVRAWAKKKGYATSTRKHPINQEQVLVVSTGQ